MDFKSVIVFFYLSSCCFNIVYCLTCLSCNNIIQPRHCHEVTVCNSDEVCGVEKLRASMGFQSYQLGCVSKSTCSNGTSMTGARCRQCCYGDLCNAAVCGEPDYPHTRGPICYACRYHTDQQPCRSIQFCTENEECGIIAVVEFGDTILTSGCKPKHSCQDPNAPPPAFIGRRAVSVSPFTPTQPKLPVTPPISVIATYLSRLPTSPPTSHGFPPISTISSHVSQSRSTPTRPARPPTPPSSTFTLPGIPPTLSSSTYKQMPFSPLTLPGIPPTSSSSTYKQRPSSPFSLPGIPPTLSSSTYKQTSPPSTRFPIHFTVKTTPASVSTTMPPVSTTSPPVSTTSPSVSTTSLPVSTTSPPVSTTSSPATVTSPPVTTRRTPATTTASKYVCNKCCSQDLCNLNCSTTNLCATSSCKNGACVVANSTATCVCSPGWLGTRCDKFDHCASSPCRHGSCVPIPSSYSCSCYFGWSGRNCDVSTFTSYNCNFEIGLCTWTQSGTDDFDWTRNSGSTSSTGTGPSGDHTSGSGYYMYIETSNGNTGYKADLVSKLIPPNPPAHPYCFGLALNMYGSEMGSINIYIKPERKTKFLIQHYKQITNDQTWHVRNLTLPTQSRNFNIVVEGVRGTGYMSDAAIDDLTVSPGPC